MPPVDTAIPPSVPGARVGYVCKVYPRFSETFIVTEILAHERAGLDLEIFSLRPPLEGRFHELLGEVRSRVTYLDADQPKLGAAWAELRAAMSDLPGMGAALPDLIATDARDAFQAIALARAVRDRGLTHLHAHFGSVATTVARLASRLSGVPYSFTAHAKDIFHDDVDLDDLGRKIADAATVVTVSDFNVTHLEGLFGPQGSLRRIYNGLDLTRFPYRDPALRPTEVVSVGRLVEKKGLAHLIDAMAILRNSHPAVRCTIVGGGPLEAELRARITALELEDRVSLTGPLPQAEVRRIVGGAAAFAAPCVVGGDGNRDGLPTVLLEAMALGTPCIGTDVTGIPEVLTHGETGVAIRQGDARDLATAIARLVDDPALRSDLAAQARRRIEEDFDTERQTARLRGCFTRGVHAAPPSDRIPALVP